MTTIVAFTAENVCKLTGLTPRQLRYWDSTGFFTPHYADESRNLPHSRIYDFRDLVGLRAIALLRNTYNVSLQHLRKVGAWLNTHYETPWASLRFYVRAGKVYFDDPMTGDRVVGIYPGQTAFPFEMDAIAHEMDEKAEHLKERQADQIGKITRNRFIKRNAWVIAGTRIPVSAVQSFAREGYNVDQIIAEYPILTAEDVRAALMYENEPTKQKRAG